MSEVDETIVRWIRVYPGRATTVPGDSRLLYQVLGTMIRVLEYESSINSNYSSRVGITEIIFSSTLEVNSTIVR